MTYKIWWRRGRRARTVVAVALALTAAACTTTTSDDPTSQPSPAAGLPSVSDVPTILDTSKLRLPLDRYLPTLEESAQRSAAQRELVRRCMKRFHLTIVIPEPPAGLGLKSRNERRYGLTDQTAAAKIGYGLGERDPDARPSGDDEAPVLGPKALAVLTGRGPSVPAGVPADGCHGEAQGRLAFVDPSTERVVDDYLPQRLSLESFQRSQEDPRVLAAYADWSSCMHARGHEYPKPLDPNSDPKFQPAGSARERQTAVDDVVCKEGTNLVGRWYAVESAYQTALIHDHEAELTAVARAAATNQKIVRAVLKRPTMP